MNHPQAMALAAALVSEEVLGVTGVGDDASEVSRFVNQHLLDALAVARPGLPLSAYHLYAYHFEQLPNVPNQQKHITARRALGEFLKELGEALIDCVKPDAAQQAV